MQLRRTTLIVGALCLYLLTPLAQAGGLWISEHGSPAQGRADDASASFHNPASMSRVDRSQMMASVGVQHTRPKGLKLGAEFTYADYGSAKIRATGFSGD